MTAWMQHVTWLLADLTSFMRLTTSIQGLTSFILSLATTAPSFTASVQHLVPEVMQPATPIERVSTAWVSPARWFMRHTSAFGTATGRIAKLTTSTMHVAIVSPSFTAPLTSLRPMRTQSTSRVPASTSWAMGSA